MAITFGKSSKDLTPYADPAYTQLRDEAGNAFDQWSRIGDDGTAQYVNSAPMLTPQGSKYGILSDLMGDDKAANVAALLGSVAQRAGLSDFDFGPTIQSQMNNSSIWGKQNDNHYLWNNPTDIVSQLAKATGDPRLANVQFTPEEQKWSSGVGDAQQGLFQSSRDTGLRLSDMAMLAAIGAGGGAALGFGAGPFGFLDGSGGALGAASGGGVEAGGAVAGAEGGFGVGGEGLDAIGQLVQSVPEGMTATSYAASQGFPSADAWLASLGGGAGAAAGSAAGSGGLGGEAAVPGYGAENAYDTLGGGVYDASNAYGTLGAAGAGTAASGASALSKLLSGTAGGDDILKLLGQVAPGLIDAYGANQKAGTLNDLANQFSAYGAPSRARYEASMTPGFDPYTSIAGYKGAVDTASDSVLRKLSASGGNPYGNPGALVEANKAVINSTALPAVQEYQRLNAGAGGLANLASAYPSAATNAAGASSGVYSGLGDALGNVLSPQKLSLADLLKQFGSQSGLA